MRVTTTKQTHNKNIITIVLTVIKGKHKIPWVYSRKALPNLEGEEWHRERQGRPPGESDI